MRSTLACFVVLGLTACASGEDSAVESWNGGHLASPPPSFSLELDGDMIPGRSATFVASGVAAGDQVWFTRGSSAGAGPCPPALGGCLDVNNPELLGNAVADATGEAELTVMVPGFVQTGIDVALQAVVLGNGEKSDVVETVLVHADARSDFSLLDENSTSPRYNTMVSPRDYLGKISGWYFGHAT